MTTQSGNFTSARSRYMTQQNRTDEAKRALEEQRTKALYHLYRTGQMEVAQILGLSPAPALIPMWRDGIE